MSFCPFTEKDSENDSLSVLKQFDGDQAITKTVLEPQVFRFTKVPWSRFANIGWVTFSVLNEDLGPSSFLKSVVAA